MTTIFSLFTDFPPGSLDVHLGGKTDPLSAKNLHLMISQFRPTFVTTYYNYSVPS
nr:MAG TPA: hypothetical protein [Caudoviricetes sp.]